MLNRKNIVQKRMLARNGLDTNCVGMAKAHTTQNDGWGKLNQNLALGRGWRESFLIRFNFACTILGLFERFTGSIYFTLNNRDEFRAWLNFQKCSSSLLALIFWIFCLPCLNQGEALLKLRDILISSITCIKFSFTWFISSKGRVINFKTLLHVLSQEL